MRFITKTLRTMMALLTLGFLSATSVNAQLLTESFENGGSVPANWAAEAVTGTAGTLTFVTSSTSPTVAAAANGTYFVKFNSYNASTGSANRLKMTTGFSTVDFQDVVVNFSWYEDPAYSSSADKVTVQWSTDGATWTSAGDFLRYNTTEGWKDKSVTLPAGANDQPNLYLAFLFTSAWGNNCHFDNVVVNATSSIASVLTGVVTNAATGLPVVGAKVMVGDSMTYTLLNGTYSLNMLGGPASFVVEKEGFENFIANITLVAGANTQDAALLENTAAPGVVLATLNTAQTAVNLTWGLPMSGYEIIYDDGVFENMTTWATAGNINALKFTPINQYPVTITGGSVFIGDGNFPVGGNPLVPFEMAVYDDDGTQGIPNTELGRVEVTPTHAGWVEFEFTSAITIGSGNFYLGMIQGGNHPNCAPLGIDETNPSMRSYSKYATANGPWVPAGYNDFMIRAKVQGSGGPGDMATSAYAPMTMAKTRISKGAISMRPAKTVGGPEGEAMYVPMDNGENVDGLLGYQVFRFIQGEENNQAVWTTVSTPTATNTVDNSWPTLPNGAYRWAVKAKYTGDRWSEPSFSNVLGKGWTAQVKFNVTLSSVGAVPEGVSITMQNTLVDTLYYALTPASGQVTFNTVWKGNYDITVYKFGYEAYNVNKDIYGDMTLDVLLGETRWAPFNLYVDDRTLEAVWNAPIPMVALFEDHFTSGNFTAQGWTKDGNNWVVTTGAGMPAPSAMFNWEPQVTNYSQSITTPELQGLGSPVLELRYDIMLSNYGNTTENQMAVELWDGTTWNRLKNYSNVGGDIPWTSEILSLNAYTWDTFKIRFNAYGGDTYDINNWNVDNVMVLAKLGADKNKLGYNVYLDDVQIAFTTDTTYLLPASIITYGQQYTACVDAVYESGTSDRDCYTFTAHFLPAPRELAATPVQDAAYLTWLEPVMPGKKLSENANANLPVVVAQPAVETADNQSNYIGSSLVVVNSNPTDAELYNNGPFVNSPGTGTGGADESILQGGLGMGTYGSGCQQTAGNSIADDVVVPSAWTVNELDVFTYQTGSTTTSTITGAMVRVWNGDPSAGGTVIWGDLTTNVMTSTEWTNCYRNDDGPGGSTNRPIMKVTCDLGGLALAPGTYWIEWTLTGSLSSGPWCPAITINGQTTTGNALQNQSGTWAPLTDVGPQGMPFVLRGNGGGGASADVMGYNIYRDGMLIDYVGADTTEYYDLYLNPGHYCYDVTAVYDLTQFGMTGTAESLEEGPACIDINYGVPAPFIEDWNSTNFTYNTWSFEPEQGEHWKISNAMGNGVPSAEFNWAAPENDYSYAMITPAINASIFTCGKLMLDFDLKLEDRNQTGKEIMTVDRYINGNWKTIGEYKNEGSFNWSTKSIEITGGIGKAVKIRFVAHGDNTADIIAWYVDNIKVYPVLPAPSNLTGVQNENNIDLTWNAAICEEGGAGTAANYILDDGSFEDGLTFNPGYTGWLGNEFATTDAGVLTSFDLFFVANASAGSDQVTVDIFDENKNLVGSTGLVAPAGDAWVTVDVPNVAFDGTFYAMVKWNNFAAATHYFGMDQDGPNASSDPEWYYDGSAWDKLSNMGFSACVMGIRAHALVGKGGKDVVYGPLSDFTPAHTTIAPASLAVANRSVVSNNMATSTKIDLSDISRAGVVGYNVYRDGVLLNATPQTDTTYADHNLEYGAGYCYTVKAVYNGFNNLMESAPTNEKCYLVYVGIEEGNATAIKVYPNPATDVVTVEATADVRNITLVNYLGQPVMNQDVNGQSTIKLNVSNLESGVYFVRFTTADGSVSMERITVTR